MASLLASGTVLHGRYSILKVLRASRRSALYVGTDLQAATKEVAIHEHFDPSPDAQATFMEEARMLAALEHPSLPVVLDYFVEPSGLQYLVTEHIEGQRLDEVLAQGQGLSESAVLAWFDRLLAAVEYLHAQHPPIIHGGIAPANLVIGTDGVPRLLNLVIGQDLAEGEGDPQDNPFAAPEQHLGQTDQRSDMYAIGATLYALLTGRQPPSPRARSNGQEIPTPSSLVQGISPQVEAAIMKALALDPQQRFDTPAELWQAMQPMHAPKPKHRRRLPVLVGIIIDVICILAAGILLWQFLSPILAPTLARWRAKGRPVVFVTVTPIQTTLAATTVPAALADTPTQVAVADTTTPKPSPSATAPVATSTRAATAQPSATALPSPTTLPSATPAPRASQTPTAVVPSPTPLPTATVRPFPPPVALWPEEGASLTGALEFRWYWPEPLAADEYFDLQVWPVGQQPAGIVWCKETVCQIAQLGSAGHYQWRVQVIRGHDGQVRGTVTAPGETRSFTWNP